MCITAYISVTSLLIHSRLFIVTVWTVWAFVCGLCLCARARERACVSLLILRKGPFSPILSPTSYHSLMDIHCDVVCGRLCVGVFVSGDAFVYTVWGQALVSAGISGPLFAFTYVSPHCLSGALPRSAWASAFRGAW